MKEENKMYEYLLEHNYISKNETKSPLRQQELSKERAECIVNKYDSLIKDLQFQLKAKEEVEKKFIKYLEYQVKFQEELNDIHLATGFEEILSKFNEILSK